MIRLEYSTLTLLSHDMTDETRRPILILQLSVQVGRWSATRYVVDQYLLGRRAQSRAGGGAACQQSTANTQPDNCPRPTVIGVLVLCWSWSQRAGVLSPVYSGMRRGADTSWDYEEHRYNLTSLSFLFTHTRCIVVLRGLSPTSLQIFKWSYIRAKLSVNKVVYKNNFMVVECRPAY